MSPNLLFICTWKGTSYLSIFLTSRSVLIHGRFRIAVWCSFSLFVFCFCFFLFLFLFFKEIWLKSNLFKGKRFQPPIKHLSKSSPTQKNIGDTCTSTSWSGPTMSCYLERIWSLPFNSPSPWASIKCRACFLDSRIDKSVCSDQRFFTAFGTIRICFNLHWE